MKKKVVILFPGSAHRPIGGHKVVYEYANRFVADGYEVDMVYPAFKYRYGKFQLGEFLWRFSYATLNYIIRYLFHLYSCRKWFPLDKRIREHWVYSLRKNHIPNADIYIATAIKTSVYLNSYKDVPNGSKLYFIQGYECWGDVSKTELHKTYHFPFRKIAVSHWLKKVIEDTGESCTLIRNGFDFNYFSLAHPIETRSKFMICMGFSASPNKGSFDAIEALNIVKEKYPQLEINVFSAEHCPKFLPNWYHYYRIPDQETHNRILNDSAIFIAPSWSEGFGLTVGEAMICGCAVVCADNPGHQEMAIHGKTALLSPIKDSKALASNIIQLIENDSLRYQIANNGHQFIQNFTWNDSYLQFKQLVDATSNDLH